MSTIRRPGDWYSFGFLNSCSVRHPSVAVSAALMGLGLLFGEALPSVLSTAQAESGTRPKGRLASFVMENTVSDDRGTVLSRHEVIFREGSAFDLPQDPSLYATIIDFGKQEVTLLDRGKQSKTTLPFESLMRISDQAMSMMAEQPDAKKLGVGAEIQISEDSTQFSTRYGDVSYQIETASVDDRLIAIAYAQFVDLASRLDLLKQSGPPPFARMAIHSRINSKGRIPLKTSLQRTSGGQTQTLTASHQRRDLGEADARRINELKGMVTLFKPRDWKSFP